MARKQNRDLGGTAHEYRSADISIVSAYDEEREHRQLVEGYAAVVESPAVICSIDGIQYMEVIDKHAFDDCDFSDVPFKYNHNDSCMVLARTRNNTLQLSVDERGLRIVADLAKTSTGKDLYELIKRGDIDKMSFGFTVKEDSYDSITHTRRILKIDKIWDVSAVDVPAYSETSIQARNYFSMQNELAEQEQLRQMRKKLYLLTY